MALENDLWTIVQRHHPETLFLCGDTAEAIGKRWQQYSEQPVTLAQVKPSEIGPGWGPSSVYQLALITGTLEQLSYVDGEMFLGQLRNFGATRIAVLVADTTETWDFNALIGLGFKRFRHDEAEMCTLYTYDIETYNPKREWNSPEHWANPENWGKYRW